MTSPSRHPTPRPTSEGIAAHLRVRASWLSRAALAACVGRVLAHEGYREVRMLDALPGLDDADLEALVPERLGRAAALVRLRRRSRAAPARAVSDLRGAMRRLGARHGVIVSASSFSRRARLAAAGDPDLRVRLIDGAELGRLMLAARIGVVEEVGASAGEGRLGFSQEAFMELGALARPDRTEQSRR